MKCGLGLVGLVLLLVSPMELWAKSAADEYQRQQLTSETLINGDKVFIERDDGGFHLLISGNDLDNKWLTLFKHVGHQPLSAEHSTALPLPPGVQFFNKGRLANHDREQIFYLSADKLWSYNIDSGVMTSHMDINTLYRGQHVPQFRQLDFVFDVNGDGLTDIILPDFEHNHLYVQTPLGQFIHYPMALTAKMIVFGSGPQYRLRQPHLFDANNDGLQDILFQRDDQLAIFEQTDNGRFTLTPRYLALNAGILADHKTSMGGGDGRDRSDLTVTSFEQLIDLNDDQIPDLVIQERRQKGVFNIENHYPIHYGRRQQGQLYFNSEPDTRVSTRGIQFELNFTDINNDGLTDVYTPTIEVGVGTIIGGLLSGSADLDVVFYLMGEQQSYHKKPTQQKAAEIAFDLSSGSTSYPALSVADFNGDRLNDLLIQSSEKKVSIYYGEQKRVFARRAKRITLPLPKDGQLLDARDLNGDGRADLLFHYGNDDPVDKRYDLRLLLSKTENSGSSASAAR